MWEERSQGRAEIAFARPRVGTAMMMGDESRLARLIDNLVDNAISFSPPGGLVQIGAVRLGERGGDLGAGRGPRRSRRRTGSDL